jgi:acetoin utilization deacetylase AcuC-like enzyme
MATGLISSERFLEHDTGASHPERPDRLRAITQHLWQSHRWQRMRRLPFEPADMQWVERVHSRAYIGRVRAACEAGEPFIDAMDSAICPVSYDIAQLAVGGVLAAVDAVLMGQVRNAFCAIRPPGHHAEHDRSMGFCLFCNAAIAADYAIARHGLDRVAIVDFDVHHGNGTQHLLERRGDVLFVSLHEHPAYLYPGTGFAWERGEGEGMGATLNLPMPPRSGDDAYVRAMEQHVVPALTTFGPQLLIISAGFDAALDDPLAHQEVTAAGFRRMTGLLCEAAEQCCEGRLVSVLEGGYDLPSLVGGVEAHLDVLMG